MNSSTVLVFYPKQNVDFRLSRLQSVLNAAARLIHRSSQYEHVTPMMRDLHWLRSPERIDFKLAVLT